MKWIPIPQEMVFENDPGYTLPGIAHGDVVEAYLPVDGDIRIAKGRMPGASE